MTATATRPTIAVEQLVKRYGDDVVVDDVTLAVAPGETVVVVGPSGAGKSTLCRCMAGLEPVDGGRVLFCGDELASDSKSRHAIRGDIGMVFQQFNLFPHLNALENVALAPQKVRGAGRKEAHDQAAQLLEKVGLAGKAASYPDDLSGGQQQRVAIARALAMTPKLMLFDEPTASLDPELTREVLATMVDLARSGMTLVVVTHELGFARRAATRIVLMENGRILEEGPPEQLFNDPREDRTRQYLESHRDA
jgi:glutamate transport system ATP-binding protein